MSEKSNGVAPPSETLTYASPEEIVEFVERVRIPLYCPKPSPGVMTVIDTGPYVTRTKCEWENCPEPSTAQYRWRIEAADGVRDAFNIAVYCDGHGGMASTHGAVLVERFT